MLRPPCSTLNINLISGPGVGKSVLMAQLFAALKLKGVHAETVSEYAKELTYMGTLSQTSQREIAREQLRRQSILQGSVQVAITDSGVPLSLAYCTDEERQELTQFVRDGMSGWSNINVLLQRDVRDSYEPGGRNQSAEEAHEIHHQVIAPFSRQYFGSDLVELSTREALDVLLDLIEPQIPPLKRLPDCATP